MEFTIHIKKVTHHNATAINQFIETLKHFSGYLYCKVGITLQKCGICCRQKTMYTGKWDILREDPKADLDHTYRAGICN